MGILFVIFLALLASVLIVLVLGMVMMARGDEASRRRSNQLMKLRVILQAAALVVFVMALAAGRE